MAINAYGLWKITSSTNYVGWNVAYITQPFGGPPHLHNCTYTVHEFKPVSFKTSSVQIKSTAAYPVGAADLAAVDPIWTLLVFNEKGFTYRKESLD